jgi:hypothetical protein
MTDLEITKLCAEAMGYVLEPYPKGFRVREPEVDGIPGHVLYSISEYATATQHYDPLHDDAQAMALVKKLEICCWKQTPKVVWQAWSDTGLVNRQRSTEHKDLNLAICECVAKMQRDSAHEEKDEGL